MKIATKQMIGFTSIALLVAIVGFLGDSYIGHIEQNLNEVTKSAPLIDSAMEMKLSVANDKETIIKILHAKTIGTLDAEWKAHEANITWYENFTDAILNGAKTDEGTIYAAKDGAVKKIIQEAGTFHNNEFRPLFKEIYTLSKNNISNTFKSGLAMEEFEAAFDKMIALLVKFEDKITQEMAKSSSKSAAADKTLWITAARKAKTELAMGRIYFEEFAQTLNSKLMEETKKEISQSSGKFDKSISALLKGGETSGGYVPAVKVSSLKSVLEETNEIHNGEFQSAKKYFIEFQETIRKNNQTQNELLKKIQSVSADMTKMLDDAENQVRKAIDKTEQKAKDTVSKSSSNLIILVIAGFVFAIGLGTVISRGINQILTNLVNNLSHSAEQLVSASGQISESSQQLSQGATQQASSLQETSSSMEQISSQTKENADNAKTASSAMGEVAEIVKRSEKNSEDAAAYSGNTKDSAQNGVVAMEEINSAMKEIHEGSNKITDIIEVISEITHQTKMLATNAAIEAARAGDQGKGFAVVADEVSKLAEHSKSAAKDIASLIKDSSVKAKKGSNLAQKGEGVLREILEKSTKTSHLVNEISSSSQDQSKKVQRVESLMDNIRNASNEQANGISQVSLTVVDLDKVTQANASSAEENASASEELSSQAQMLQRLVNDISQHVGLKDITYNQNGNGKGDKKSFLKTFTKKNSAGHFDTVSKSDNLYDLNSSYSSQNSTLKGNGNKKIDPEDHIAMREDFKEF